MRNVSRPSSPAILASKSSVWTIELLKAIKDVDAKNKQLKPKQQKFKVSATVWNRYKHDQVNAKLMDMYGKAHGGLCCYCEQRVGHVSYEHIEHRKPKSKFPESAFDWLNLHLACPACNTPKGNQWDSKNPILDAAVDANICTVHLSYEFSRLTISRKAVSDRGATTISHAKLNRPEIADLAANGTRNQVICSVFETVTEIRDVEKIKPKSPQLTTAKAELRKHFSGELGSLVEFYSKRILQDV